jgi:hypothetical protein
MPITFGRHARLRTALVDAGVSDKAADLILAAVWGDGDHPTSVTSSVAERWAWRVANREITLDEFATQVWHATSAERAVPAPTAAARS